jgi:sugar lactone lactonase YvrE
VITVFSPNRQRLGEGPLWDPRTRTLHWVDIVAGHVFSQPDGATEPRVAHLGVQVSCLGLTADPNILVAGLRTGWHLVNLDTGWRQLLGAPEQDRETCRFNDGSVDEAGRFWTGSLEDSESGPDGRLYRLDPDGSYRIMDEGFYCSNGIDWSPDGRWMYFVDSRQDRIYRYAFDSTDGEARDREIFIDTTALEGIPDGLRVDAAGDIWCAFWDGAQIIRFAPDGTVQEQVAVPVLRPTSIAFGGADLRTMYITSASLGLTTSEMERWPQSGMVLHRPAGTPGRPAHVFASHLVTPGTANP